MRIPDHPTGRRRREDRRPRRSPAQSPPRRSGCSSIRRAGPDPEEAGPESACFRQIPVASDEKMKIRPALLVFRSSLASISTLPSSVNESDL